MVIFSFARMCLKQGLLNVVRFYYSSIYRSSWFETEGTYTAVSMRTAITQAFKKVEKKGTICQLWQTGKFLYTAGSWGATALS
jgi:hypothetical protein